MTPDKNRKSYEKVGRIYNAIIQFEREIFIERVLQTEGDINYRVSEGSTLLPNLLHAALSHPNNEIFKLLLKYGADFTYKDEENRTAVHVLVQEHFNRKAWFRTEYRNDLVDAILAAHLKFNNPTNPSDDDGFTHFHAACMANNSSVMELFLNNGVDVDHAVNVDSSYFPLDTPLHIAVKRVCFDAVETLLKHGANVHLKNVSGSSPLQLIIRRKIEDFAGDNEDDNFKRMLSIFAKFLFDDDRTSINATDDDFDFRKFHFACLLHDQSLVESVLKQVTNVNQPVSFDSPNFPGYTALHFAAFSNVRIFKLLLKNGADIVAKNAEGQTPLDLAVKNYSVKDVYDIISEIPEWSCVVLSDNETKLIDVVLALEDNDEFVSLLDGMKSPSTVTVPFDSPLWPGYTLLHLAVVFSKGTLIESGGKSYNVTIIDVCLKRGADVTAMKDSKGCSTALHLAFYMGKRRLVEYLLDRHGKSNNPVDKNNLSHFHIACAVNHQKAVEYFLSMNADVNSQVNSTFECPTDDCKKSFFICPGSTALHISVGSGNSEITKKLLEHGADVNLPDVNGFTPVHRSFDNDDGISSILLSDVHLKNMRTSCGLSHLHVACIAGHASSINELLDLDESDINVRLTCKYDYAIADDNNELPMYGDPRYPLAFLSDYAGYAPLDFVARAIVFVGVEVALLMIERNADVLVKDAKGTCPLETLLPAIDHSDLHLTRINQNIVIQEYLNEEYGITQLHVACRIADVRLVKKLIKHGVNVNAKVNCKSPMWQGYTALHCAVKTACEDRPKRDFLCRLRKIVELLMKHGADPLLADNNNDTPFHLIKYHYSNSYESAYLLEVIFPLFAILFNNVKNFNVIPTNSQGLSLFHIACMTVNEIIVEKYLEHNCVDVNQAIGYFSKDCPGSTPLHLVIDRLLFHRPLNALSWKFGFTEKTFLRIVDMLLKKGADVNATDASGRTALFTVVRLTALRKTLIKKLISNGADVHVLDVSCDTSFQHLLMCGHATWEEIEFFLNAGSDFNTYHPTSHEGYLAIFLHYYRGMVSSRKIMENQLLFRIINNPKIIEIDNLGRTVVHNLVSIYPDIDERWDTENPRDLPVLVRLLRSAGQAIGLVRNYGKTTLEANPWLYAAMIEQLLIRGCDIDHQDNEGKTALHLAAAFDNYLAIRELLKNGADINVTDEAGTAAFAYYGKSIQPQYDRWDDESHLEIGDYYSNYIHKIFAMHVYKLKFCRQPVNEENEQLQLQVLKSLGPIKGKALECFHGEMNKTKSIKIGSTSLSLYEFLTNEDMTSVYVDMTNEEREEVDGYFENVDKLNFREIDCLLKLKYRKAIERTKLMEPAVASLNSLIEFLLPDLCCRNIFKFLNNEDLKRLIASTN